MDRRQFISASAATGGLALLATLGVSRPATAVAPGPYGPLRPADNNGLQLPASFSSKIVATTDEPVASTDYRWHPNPDGGAAFALTDGGWAYVSNDESDDSRGGASMIRFDADGAIIDARRVLNGSSRNCAGGATPWGTWLSCEEFSRGRVWECDPLGATEATVRPAMGAFRHEAAAADATSQVVYMTEDQPDGGLYRFVPTNWTDLSSGQLQVLTRPDQQLEWTDVPDPSASNDSTRKQLDTMVRFDGGEGIWYEDGRLYFTTKGDNRVWRLDTNSNQLDVIYDIKRTDDPVLGGVDNIAMSPAGDLFVCEDGGNMEIVVLTATGEVSPFLRIGQSGSELTGVSFDPSGTRMYFSSQRGPGRTYEVTGPFGGDTQAEVTSADDGDGEPRAAATRGRSGTLWSEPSRGQHR